MSDDKIIIPDELVEALKEHRVIPFIGAGVSRAVQKRDKDASKSFNPLFPNWKEFLDYSVEKLKSKKEHDEAEDIKQLLSLKKPMYLEAAKRASNSLGETLWHQMLKEKLDLQKAEADENSLKLPEIVWELGSNLLITTNVDRVLQWTCPNPQEFRPLDMEKLEIGELQKEKDVKYPTSLYLHGRIHNKRNVVFTPEQYKNFYEEGSNQAKLQTLLNLLTSFTTLFIGFSMDDEYFLKQLDYIDEIYESGANSFYILLPEDEKNNPNIPKYVEKIIYPHHGQPLLDLLERMKKIAKGEDDSDNSNLPQPPDLPPVKGELITTTSPTLSVTFSTSQKLFKSTLAEKHFNVPFASKGNGFVGRVGKLDEIWNALNKDSRAAIGQAVAIEGFGGLGKTQLVVEYAHEYQDKYENGVFWLTADQDMSVQLIKIGEKLNWISQSDTGFDQAELVRNRFRKLSDCLIIFDNVDEQAAIKDYLPEVDFHPHILVTSREEQPDFHPINLDTLSEDEASKLLTQIANRSPKTEAEEKAFENVLKELDGLPLAVELVGGYLLRRRAITFQDYLEYLENEPIDRIEENFPKNLLTKRDKSIIRALKISEKLLSETEYLEDILDILAWSGKSSMGYSLLRELVGTNDNHTLKEALSVALELHFIKQEENEERYAIHRLLARVRQFEKPLTERNGWHQEIVRKMVGWFRERKDEFEYLKEFEAEIVHLQQWQSQSSDILPIETVYLTNFEAYPLWHRGNYQESEILLEKSLNLYQKNQLKDDKLQSNIYNDLAVINSYLGNIRQALEFEQKALSIGRIALNEKSEDIAKFLNNLGGIYGKLGNYLKALELQQQALDIYQELFGEKHPDVATSLNDLGNTYGKLGNYLKALELQQQALDIYQELFGEKHPNVATSLNNLGITNVKLGNHLKALELQQQALDIYQELFGEKHPNVARSLNSLGYTYGELGNYQKAVNFYEKALQIRQESSGNQHPITILYSKNLILELVKIGYREKAGRLAGEFLSYVPQDSRFRPIFEKYGAAYRKAKQKKKKSRH